MFPPLTLSAAGILLREGLEALLVITALAAYLSRIQAHHRLTALWSGAGLGVIASLITAWVFSTFYGGAHNDLLEGVTMFIAAGLMLYVSGWLFLRQNPRLWQSYLKGQVDKALGSGSALAVGSLAFLAIYREGAETALFLNALAQKAGSWNLALLSGLGLGTLTLVVLFVVLRTTALRLPLRPMFLATSALLFVMALNFLAGGLLEFQELGWVPLHDAPLAWLKDYSLEALALMAVVALNTTAFTLLAQSSTTQRHAPA